MAKVNWFPGHMAKSLRLMQEEIKNIDMLLYVLDARAPFSCFNPRLTQIAVGKPVLFVLNKCDLADDAKNVRFKNYITKNFGECIILNSIQSGANKIIEPKMREICSAKFEKYRVKGIKTNLRAMVIGVPNSGKSTLINNLCGYKKTITGDKAGVTRGKQWLSLKNGFEVLDTPGTLWPNLEDQEIAFNLALIGSIKNEVVDMGELSIYLIDYLVKNYNGFLDSKFNIETADKTTLEILDEIAVRKNFVIKGGEIDYDKVCFSLVDDFRKGKLGKICLERVNV